MWGGWGRARAQTSKHSNPKQGCQGGVGSHEEKRERRLGHPLLIPSSSMLFLYLRGRCHSRLFGPLLLSLSGFGLGHEPKARMSDHGSGVLPEQNTAQ